MSHFEALICLICAHVSLNKSSSVNLCLFYLISRRYPLPVNVFSLRFEHYFNSAPYLTKKMAFLILLKMRPRLSQVRYSKCQKIGLSVTWLVLIVFRHLSRNPHFIQIGTWLIIDWLGN